MKKLLVLLALLVCLPAAHAAAEEEISTAQWYFAENVANFTATLQIAVTLNEQDVYLYADIASAGDQCSADFTLTAGDIQTEIAYYDIGDIYTHTVQDGLDLGWTQEEGAISLSDSFDGMEVWASMMDISELGSQDIAGREAVGYHGWLPAGDLLASILRAFYMDEDAISDAVSQAESVTAEIWVDANVGIPLRYIVVLDGDTLDILNATVPELSVSAFEYQFDIVSINQNPFIELPEEAWDALAEDNEPVVIE